MKYRIQMTEKAEEQLRDLAFYIANNSGSVDVAIKYVEGIRAAIEQLAEFPHLGRIPKYSILRRQGYRVLIVDKYMTFYKTDDEKEIVMIYAVISSRREYERLL